MKVLMLNGSPHLQGNTYIALHEMGNWENACSAIW